SPRLAPPCRNPPESSSPGAQHYGLGRCHLTGAWSKGTLRRQHSARGPALDLLRNQPQGVYAGSTDVVHDLQEVTVLGASVTPDIDRLVELRRDAVFDLGGDLVQLDLGVTKVHLAIPGDSDNGRVFLLSVLHEPRIHRLSHVHAKPLLQHG